MRFEHRIKRIVLFEEGRQARVEATSTLDFPGMRMVSRSRDTLERRRWRTRMVGSVAVVHAGAADGCRCNACGMWRPSGSLRP